MLSINLGVISGLLEVSTWLASLYSVGSMGEVV